MIRDATPADAPAIAAIWNPIIRNTAITFTTVEKSPTDIATLITARQTEGHAFLVIEQAAQVAGFATYAQFRSGPGYAHTMEHTILLAPSARGKGLGRALLTALEDQARTAGTVSLLGGISGENAAGRAFHARMGYVQVAVLKRVGFKFRRGMDLVLMQKFLS